MTELAELKARLLEDPDTRGEYEAQAPEFAIAHERSHRQARLEF